ADKPEVHTPGINTRTIEPLSKLSGLAQGILDLLEQARQIPVKCIEKPRRLVRKAVQLFELEPFSIKPAKNTPATFCPQVESQIVAGLSHGNLYSRLFDPACA